MSSSEKLCLKWNDFQQNIQSAFGRLRQDRDFIDVTLVCEDGEKVGAHKVVLLASSPLMQMILRQDPHPHPLIYMRGTRSKHLKAIVDFLYYGEVSIADEDLSSFLALAEELKLEGLAGGNENRDMNNHPTNQPINQAINEAMNEAMNQPLNQPINQPVYPPTTHQPKKTVKKVRKGYQSADIQPVSPENFIDTTFGNDFDFEENRAKLDQNTHYGGFMEESKSFPLVPEEIAIEPVQEMNNDDEVICKVCGKKGSLGLIQAHIATNHIPFKTPRPCNMCRKTFTTMKALNIHQFRHHQPNSN